MSDKPQTVAIPPSLRAKLLDCVQERDEAVQRLEEMLELIRGVLADFGTPVAPDEYDLFNLQVGFVLREQPAAADAARLDAAERKRQRKRDLERQRNGVAVAGPAEEEEDA